VHGFEIGLQAAGDSLVAAAARAEGRALVTENVVDFAAERDVVLLFALRRDLPRRSPGRSPGQDPRRLGQTNPDPYLGPHWPDVV
jgi:hypothetical protein